MRNKLTSGWIYGIILVTGLASCEEVIDLDLGNNETGLVIEGTITTDPGPYTVKVSESINYAEVNEFPPVSGAIVTITDEDGIISSLEEVEKGTYASAAMQGTLGKSYKMEVNRKGKMYQASSTMPKTTTPIQSLAYSFEEESLFIDEGYYLTAFFTDPLDEVNYYRLKVFVNGEPYYFERDGNQIKDDNFWLINDKFFNGKVMDYQFPQKLKVGDKVDVELHQVDKSTYDYYRTLVELMGVGGVAPSNPLTNWSNGALGYFGAISVTYASIVIEGEAN